MDLNVIEEFVARMENMDEEIDENDIMLGMAMFLFDDESESDDEENGMQYRLWTDLFIKTCLFKLNVATISGQEPFVWTKVTANIDEYRFMQNVSFRLHFRMSRVVFEVCLFFFKIVCLFGIFLYLTLYFLYRNSY